MSEHEVHTGTGDIIRFSILEGALAYTRARRNVQRVNRWMAAGAFAVVLAAMAIGIWRYF